MKDFNLRAFFLFALAGFIAATVIFWVAQPMAGDTKDGPAPGADIVLGGQLYDNWPKIKSIRTDSNHPLYPATGIKKGTSTWRCKECHGWDYLGKDGLYSMGSHYTGIKGVLDTSRRDAGENLKALTNSRGDHDFSGLLDERDLASLALFLSKGLLDVREGILPDGQIPGSTDNGKVLYGAQCATCHGSDGGAIDFKDSKSGIQGVGWRGRDNPQETLHKIRWGHPGTPMPSAVVDGGATDKETLDILRYSITLEK